MAHNSEDRDKDLSSKVCEWLAKEGYPLEFEAASILRASGFRVRQGEYVRNIEGDSPREIDVTAAVDAIDDSNLLRIYQVVECKWSRDRPWVVFTSPSGIMAPSACAAQSIASSYGSALMWAVAGEPEVLNLQLFKTPKRPGFNGREAFNKGQDRFYNSLKAATDVASDLVSEYDRGQKNIGKPPRNAVIAFPVILVEGCLFEAYYCETDKKTKIDQVDQIRCHWRGAPSRRWHSTIDIVTLDHFERFSNARFEEIRVLQSVVKSAHNRILKCFEENSLDPLQIKRAARGMLGIPPILTQALGPRSAADKQSLPNDKPE